MSERKPTVTQHHHRIRLGHRIDGAIVVHGQPRDYDYPLIPLRVQRAPRIDYHCIRRGHCEWPQGKLAVHARQQKPDRYWFAPQATKCPGSQPREGAAPGGLKYAPRTLLLFT